MSKYIFNNDTDILEFLEQLRENGIQIWGEGEKIRYRSKNRQLAPETLRILKMAKGQILDFFRMIEKNVIPLTSIQTAYVVGQTAGCELGNINAHYYIEYTIESLDVERLEQMINLVISKNDALRLIVTHEGKASFLDNVPYYSVPVYSLYDGNDREQKRLERSHHRYNYYKWPMFHFCVGKTSGKTSVLHVDFDCIILDAWSAKLLLNEIFSLYYGKDVKFPRISFMNYMRLKTDKGDLEAEEYWKEKVKNMPSFPKLNYQKKFAEVQNVRFDRIECDFSFIETQRLYQKIKNYHFTPAAVISTIFMKTLAQYSETPGLSINVTLFNRQLLHEDVNAVFRYDKRENYDIEIIIRDAREVTRFVSGLSEVEGILFYGWSEGVRVCTTLVSDFPNAQALILQSGIAEGWSSYFSYILRELTVEKLKELDNNSDSILEISDFLNCIPDSTSISFSLYLLILGTDKEGNMKFNEELDPEGKGRFSIIDNWIPLADEIVADPTTLIRFAENAPGETWAGILDDIKKIQLPILVLHGLNDGWISPVEAVQIAKAARNNADIILFKGLGHSLSKVSSPLKDEGGTIEDEVIVRVVKWLKKNVE